MARAGGMLVYYYPSCVRSWRMKIALHEKGIRHYRYKQAYPSSSSAPVPSIVFDDKVYPDTEATSFLEHEFKDQGTRLIPDDPIGKARVLERTSESRHLTKHSIDRVIGQLEDSASSSAIRQSVPQLYDDLKVYEEYVKEDGKRGYIGGPSFSMADIYFFPHLAKLMQHKLCLAAYPALHDYYLRLLARPSIRLSWPPAWGPHPEPPDRLTGSVRD